jgi:hypothetical protein
VPAAAKTNDLRSQFMPSAFATSSQSSSSTCGGVWVALVDGVGGHWSCPPALTSAVPLASLNT